MYGASLASRWIPRKKYLLYVLSRQEQEDVQRDAHFLPLTAKVSREQIKKLERDDRNI